MRKALSFPHRLGLYPAIILMTGDIITTYLVISFIPGGYEMNSIMAGITPNIYLHLALKLAVFVGIVLLFVSVQYLARRHYNIDRFAGLLYLPIIIMYLFVDMQNIKVLLG